MSLKKSVGGIEINAFFIPEGFVIEETPEDIGTLGLMRKIRLRIGY